MANLFSSRAPQFFPSSAVILLVVWSANGSCSAGINYSITLFKLIYSWINFYFIHASVSNSVMLIGAAGEQGQNTACIPTDSILDIERCFTILYTIEDKYLAVITVYRIFAAATSALALYQFKLGATLTDSLQAHHRKHKCH